MAWSVGRATWVAALSDPEIAQQVGTRTFDRGVAYAAEARVRSLASRPDGLMLLGTIEGSGSETYQTIIEARPHPKGRAHLWSGRCSCPVGTDCKHTVALLLVARDVAHGIVPARPGTEADESASDGTSDPATARPGESSAPSEVHWAELLGHVRPRPATGACDPRPPGATGRPHAGRASSSTRSIASLAADAGPGPRTDRVVTARCPSPATACARRDGPGPVPGTARCPGTTPCRSGEPASGCFPSTSASSRASTTPRGTAPAARRTSRPCRPSPSMRAPTSGRCSPRRSRPAWR